MKQAWFTDLKQQRVVLLHQYVPHGFYTLASFACLVSTRFCVIRVTSYSKSNQRVARVAVVLVIAYNTNSDFRTITFTTKGIESFLGTVVL